MDDVGTRERGSPYRSRPGRAPKRPRYVRAWLKQYPFWYLPLISVALLGFGAALLHVDRGLAVGCLRSSGAPSCRLTQLGWKGQQIRSYELVISPGSRPRSLPPNDDGDTRVQVFTRGGPSYTTIVDVPGRRGPELVEGIEAFARGTAPEYHFEAKLRIGLQFGAVLAAIVLMMWLFFPRGTELRVELESGVLEARTRFPFFALSPQEYELLALSEFSSESVEDSSLERLTAQHLGKEVALGTGPARAVRAAIGFLREQQRVVRREREAERQDA